MSANQVEPGRRVIKFYKNRYDDFSGEYIYIFFHIT